MGSRWIDRRKDRKDLTLTSSSIPLSSSVSSTSLGLDCGALTSARPPLPPRPPAMASRIGLRMQVKQTTLHQPAQNTDTSLALAVDCIVCLLCFLLEWIEDEGFATWVTFLLSLLPAGLALF